MIYLELFYTFFVIGLFTIGGGAAMLPLIRQIVLEKGWLTEEMLLNIIGISESSPGPIAVNVATYIGSLQGGVLGSVCATVAVVLPSFIIICVIARFVKKFLENRVVDGVFRGVKPVVIGLIISVGAYFLLNASIVNPNMNFENISVDFRALYIIFALFVFNLAYKGIKGKQIPPITIIICSAVIGIIVYSF